MTAATWLLDLDGVVWLGDRTVPGSPEAVARLRAAGHSVAFCTNNSHATLDGYVDKLSSHGIDASERDIVSSAVAVAALLAAGERALVSGGPGVVEAIRAAGAVPVLPDDPDDGAVDAVVMGFNPAFDYRLMRRATRAVLGGARLIATNDDPIYPDADGPAPGSGAILASVERATGRRAAVAGKPNEPMAALVRERFGDGGVVVGDSPATDGRLAAVLEWRFGLVLSGNTSAGDVPEGHPEGWVASDLSHLVARHVGG